MMRLDKYLCETGFGTRSQVKDLLKKGQVMVNGEVVKKPELKINETTDQILCQGKSGAGRDIAAGRVPAVDRSRTGRSDEAERN